MFLIQGQKMGPIQTDLLNNQTHVVHCHLGLLPIKMPNALLWQLEMQRADHKHCKVFWGRIKYLKGQYTCVLLFIICIACAWQRKNWMVLPPNLSVSRWLWLVLLVVGFFFVIFFSTYMSVGLKTPWSSFHWGSSKVKLRLAAALAGRFSNHQF